MVRFGVITAVVAFLGVVMILPLATVFITAAGIGIPGLIELTHQASVWLALRLSCVAVLVSVVINGLFGIAAARWISRHPSIITRSVATMIDLPLSISPVVAGLLIVITVGPNTPVGGFLASWNIHILFTPIAVVLATLLVTLPYTAQELISFMELQGNEEEIVAKTLGASDLQTFWRVTLPTIFPALLYGSILTAARAWGEFGAVSVVSGHLQGTTMTLPLIIELMMNNFQMKPACFLASVMMLMAFFSIAARYWINHRGWLKSQRD